MRKRAKVFSASALALVVLLGMLPGSRGADNGSVGPTGHTYHEWFRA